MEGDHSDGEGPSLGSPATMTMPTLHFDAATVASPSNGGSPSSSYVIPTYRTSKLDLLPRLRRQEEQARANRLQDTGPSMAQRLERMRVEDRRRARNEQKRLAQTNGNNSHPSTMRATAPTFTPHGNGASVSASSRAGTAYFAAQQQAQRDTAEARKMGRLRAKFAGPAPPSSWRAEDSAAGQSEGTAGVGLDEQDAAQSVRQLNRRYVLSAARYFMDVRDRTEGDRTANALPSLVDLTLLSILDSMSRQSGDGSSVAAAQTQRELPSHLKERALALAGRLGRRDSIDETVLSNLFPTEDEGEWTEEMQNNNGAMPSLEEHEEEDILPDSWDTASNTGAEWSRDGVSTLDLSFAQVSSRSIRALLTGTTIQGSQIRSLSLAGWGYGEGNSSTNMVRRVAKCLRTSTGLLSILDQLTGLQVLSLAATKLLPIEAPWCRPRQQVPSEGNGTEPKAVDDAAAMEVHGLSADAASEALAFLKKLTRRTNRLQVLDLSFCRWLDGAVLANVGFYSTTMPIRRLIWPHLQHLVLCQCPAFVEAVDQIDEASPRELPIRPTLGTYVAPWHSAHHGVARTTDSPYFLAHRPGLGRAVLAHGMGGWDSVAIGRRRLIEREADALARHDGHVRTARTALAHQRHGPAGVQREQARSAFDDLAPLDPSTQTLAQALVQGYAPRTGNFAISHGVAPFASRRSATNTASASNGARDEAASVPPRCPVSGQRVPRHEWQRARVLDAVNGRWGSAIVGTLDEEEDRLAVREPEEGVRGGRFVTVYF